MIATGQTRSVRNFCDVAFDYAGLDPAAHIETDSRFLRPAEVEALLGDARKAKAKLGWEPTTTFNELVREMVDADIRRVKKSADL